MKTISIGICQVNVTKNKEINLTRAESMIANASHMGVDIAVLPEMFNCPYDKKYFTSFAESYPGKTTKFLSNIAKKYSIYIIGGSIPEKENNNIYNTSFIFDRNGTLVTRHRKIHLFDVDIKNGVKFKESDIFKPGQQVTVFNTELCKVGIAICYDMRFPELIREIALKGAELIIVPAAFNMTTGPAHWHLISRTRALDNQVFFTVASAARDRKSPYIAYGHSLVTNPWGEIIAEAGIGEEVLIADIDLDYIPKIRNELPLLRHKKDKY